MAPLTEIPLKSEYSSPISPQRPLPRNRRFRMPTRFPIATQAPARIVLWLKARDPALAARVAKAFFHAYFATTSTSRLRTPRWPSRRTKAWTPAAARAAIDDPRDQGRAEAPTSAAIARGVFGSPFVFVDGEPFWGLDRFDQIERWLATGGF